MSKETNAERLERIKHNTASGCAGVVVVFGSRTIKGGFGDEEKVP